MAFKAQRFSRKKKTEDCDFKKYTSDGNGWSYRCKTCNAHFLVQEDVPTNCRKDDLKDWEAAGEKV